jgi:recombination protein RecR
MTKLPSSLQKIINELGRLPGVGPKTAQRLAFYLLKQDSIDITNLSQSIANIKTGIVFCSVCHNMGETDPCTTCADVRRDHSLICVVEEPLDAQAIDKGGQFNGVFHILGGVLNPLEGVGPDNLEVESLLARIKDERLKIKEVIIATNPSLEGETTAMHLSKAIRSISPDVKITRIARGLPMGGDLEYADDITLMRAMEGRRDY